ncbi:N-acetylglucosaminyl-diphospho-decaprenol L-rhamnosyltransferase [mine drainage metagenome]|uniref:N-acetylglucosaminyl-diphospho-decaprenol L-rhamnosyltransferase n=1 Tax=mine drainage metagenome TaxID=410659 RepID=A0A1J5T3J0_9ZZZZ
MAPAKKKRIVVVLGMHRSGTSAITRGLMALGVGLGDHLMPGKPDNEKGFWEDLDFNALNVEILKLLGHDWDTSVPVADTELRDARLLPLRLRAVELLRQKTLKLPVFGIKDPRIARLLPFWKGVFGHLNFDIAYLIALRHPMSVARSLKKRNGFEPEKSYYLWLEHMKSSILGTDGCPRLLVDYDLFMDHPEAQLLRIADRLCLPPGPDFKMMVEAFKRDFLDAGLRHTRFLQEDLQLEPAAPGRLDPAYGVLKRIAMDDLSIESPEVEQTFTRLAQHLQEISPALRYMTALECNISNLSTGITERDNRLSSANKGIIARDEHIAALSRSVSARDEHITALEQSLIERDEHITTLSQSLTEHDEHITTLSQSLIERDGHITTLSQSLIERDGHITTLSQSLIERDERIATLDQMTAEHGRQLASLTQVIGDQTKQINAVLASRSWRVTKPLRLCGAGIRTVRTKIRGWRGVVKKCVRFFYHQMPLSQSAKWRLRSFAFRHFGSIIGANSTITVSELIAANGRTLASGGTFSGTRWFSGGDKTQRVLDYLNQPADPERTLSWGYSRFMQHLWKSRPDLQQAFDLGSEEGRKSFAHWYLMSARHEYGLPVAAYPDYVLNSLTCGDSASVRNIAKDLLDSARNGTPSSKGTEIVQEMAADLSGANLIGYARGEFGMGEHVRMVARACAEAQTPFTIIDFEEKGFHGNRDKSVDSWISNRPEYRTNIFHINADAFPALFFHFGRELFADHVNIGYWAWELANCPEEFDLALNMVDEVWAISDFVRGSFQQRSPVPVIHMPLAVSMPELQRPYDKGYFGLPAEEFVFLFTFDAASYLDRKNPLGVVSAFKRAFPDRRDGVCLVLKTMNAQESDPLWQQLRREVDGDPRIRLITSRMTRDEILGLNSVCDAFVSLHRSEGFGRCLAESMWLGKPVIATNYSGSRDFAREGTACVVDYRLIPIQEGRYPCWQGQLWADPDIEHASWFMRKLRNDAVFRDYIAKAGQGFIRKNFNEEAIGARYTKRLKEIAVRNDPAAPESSLRAVREPDPGAKETIVGRIDLPQDRAIDPAPLRGTTEIAGWTIADSGIAGVEAFVDGQRLGQAHYGILRPDVGAEYPDMEDASRCGFFWMMDTRAFANGEHRLELVVASISGSSMSLAMNVLIDNSMANGDPGYGRWLKRNASTRTEIDSIRDQLDGMTARPLLSLVAATRGRTDTSLAAETLASLAEQLYPDWELMVAADEQEGMELLRTAKELGIENRIHVRPPGSDGLRGLFRACQGWHAGVIDWGDRLDPRALFAVASTLNADPALDIIYTDEDRMVDGERADPSLKPAWSPSLFEGVNYIGRLWFARRSALELAAGSPPDVGEIPEHELLKELADKTRHVAHIPMVLYSRREAVLPRAAPIKGAANAALQGTTSSARPLVSVIIPTCLGDLGIVEKCLSSLFERTAYERMEVILVVNNVADTEATRAFLARWPAKLLRWQAPFNWSAINNFGALGARGEYLLFMNDDVEVVGRHWLDSMVRAAGSPGVGAVGATLRYPNGTLQHMGIFLADHGSGTSHAFRFFTGREPELEHLLACDRECTAVTGACMLTGADVFRKLGGFDEALPLVCNDTDYCLRLQANDYRCLVAANTELIHHEGISRAGMPETEDVKLFRERWESLLALGDPYMNPNLIAARDAWVINPEATGSLIGRRIGLPGAVDVGAPRSGLA